MPYISKIIYHIDEFYTDDRPPVGTPGGEAEGWKIIHMLDKTAGGRVAIINIKDYAERVNTRTRTVKR